jgi:hypothetical protein
MDKPTVEKKPIKAELFFRNAHGLEEISNAVIIDRKTVISILKELEGIKRRLQALL